MSLRDELTEPKAWSVEPGTPTVTFENDHEHLMLPWISFRHATKTSKQMKLYFQGWLIVLEVNGPTCQSLWCDLQDQAVKVIDGSGKSQEQEILSIRMEAT